MADDVPVAGGWRSDGLLDWPGEAVADALGGAAVEAEDILVEIGLEVLFADRAMVRAIGLCPPTAPPARGGSLRDRIDGAAVDPPAGCQQS